MALARGELERRFGEIFVHNRPRRRKLFLDFETYCELDLKKVGLDRYSAHPSCEVLMLAWGFEGETPRLWSPAEGEKMPCDLRDALEDDEIELHAFNAQFERVIMNRVLGIVPKVKRWRCTMVLAYFHSFVGDLARVGQQIGIPQDKQKMSEGHRLMKMFSVPQKPTSKQPLKRFDSLSHPVEWEMFKEYCLRDVEAEMEIDDALDRDEYPIPRREWEFYALDQIINDRGLPVDMLFVERAISMSNRRKDELKRQMQKLTGLDNPNSGPQLLPWLQERGYPFDDLRKDSVKKVLTAHEGVVAGLVKPGKDVLAPVLTDDCVKGLKLRQQSARTSVRKYDALKNAVGEDGRIRFVFQFCGASRTGRFAGRRFQPQNLTTMRDIEDVNILSMLIDCIKDDDYDGLKLLRKEPLDALAGLVRGAIRVKVGKKLVICDLSSIESVVIGWVSACERLLNVFRDGRDAYKDFATELYQVPYEAVDKAMRKMAKPATLGAGYRLGGGEIKEGKRTGLWGYAENMGVEMTRKEAHKSVATFRRVYKEIPATWYALEDAIKYVIRNKRPKAVGGVLFSYSKPYLICHLPSGRCIYYLKPQIRRKPFKFKDRDTGETVTVMKDSISYMGKQQNGSKWIRIESHGGKFIENIVQAIARDILREGLLAMHKLGFYLIGHVHDEAIAEEDEDGDLGLSEMKECMTRKIKWGRGLPLGAAGFEGVFYRKD